MASTAETASSVPTTNTRLKRFNDALEEFLKLIDERATIDNFQTALPQIKPKSLEPAREQFVFHLKDSIKLEKDRLVAAYGLEDKLDELEQLTAEAGARSTVSDDLIDVWRPNLDLATALYARSIPEQRQRVALLEQELQATEAENSGLHLQLQQTMASEEGLVREAGASLQCLDDAIDGLDTSPELSAKIRDSIEVLLRELGPRGAS